MDSFAITVFVQVAEARSFVAAGRALAISASGIGKSVTRLEEELHVRLFHRSTRSVTLTEAGEIFLARARRVLAELKAVEAELSQTSSTAQGRLRVSLPLLGEPFLSVLADFQLAYPDIELDLDFDNRKVDVIEEGFDAVVRSGDLPDSRLNARALGSFRMLLVGSPDYFARHGTPCSPDDIAQHTCIRFRMPYTGKLQEWSLQPSTHGPEPRFPTQVICNTNEARLYFARRGVGIAYISDFTVREALKEGSLVTVLDDYTTATNSFHLLWSSGRLATPKLRAFIDFMSERFFSDATSVAVPAQRQI
jgi:DNA-binding transcriptional LysR family regulator